MPNPGLKGRLVRKSVEAFAMALETANRALIHYRYETFLFLICNAWELLLKARIIQLTNDKRAIYVRGRKPPSTVRRTHSLDKCLRIAFTDETNPIRRNLEALGEMRDESMHLVLTTVPEEIMGLFQSAVLNYVACLLEWFDRSLDDEVPLGLIALASRMDPSAQDMTDPRVRRRLGSDAADYLLRKQRALAKASEEHGPDNRFQVPIEYRLALVKNPKDADILITHNPDGVPSVHLEVPKDPGRTHPYRQKELLEALNQRLPDGVTVNSYDVQCVVRAHAVLKRSEWHYTGSVPSSPRQYSEAFLDWLVKSYNSDDTFFQRARRNGRPKRST